MSKETASKQHFRNIYRFIQICIQLADIADEKQETPFDDVFHIGHRAFSGIMRGGVKEIIDLKNDYYGMECSVEIAKNGEADARNFLYECFGDREIDSINDKDRDRILFLCNKIRHEWEEKEEE